MFVYVRACVSVCIHVFPFVFQFIKSTPNYAKAKARQEHSGIHMVISLLRNAVPVCVSEFMCQSFIHSIFAAYLFLQCMKLQMYTTVYSCWYKSRQFCVCCFENCSMFTMSVYAVRVCEYVFCCAVFPSISIHYVPYTYTHINT